MGKPKAIVVDLDGTLCDHRHRLHFVDWMVPKPGYHQKPCPTCKDGFCHLDDPWIHDETGKEWKPDWDAFYAGIPDDGVNEWCYQILSAYHYEGWGNILFVTGRPEKYREITITWLHKYLGSTEFELFMRPDFLPHRSSEWDAGLNLRHIEKKPDHRPSYEVKREIYSQHIAGRYDVLFCLEDDERCAHMYRELGLTCLLVK